jgi:hypothetical protein
MFLLTAPFEAHWPVLLLNLGGDFNINSVDGCGMLQKH